MTSFTKALYRRDPAAAEAFHRAQQFEHRLTYGKNAQLAMFTMNPPKVPSFGRRIASGLQACERNCRHPACSRGCTLIAKG